MTRVYLDQQPVQNTPKKRVYLDTNQQVSNIKTVQQPKKRIPRRILKRIGYVGTRRSQKTRTRKSENYQGADLG